MTTFTYCIFALGHILARQFPIVGFRPPVRLIDIIGRAADTRLHFYLHTFADQFARSPAIRSLLSLCCCSRIGIFRFLLSPPCSATPTIGRRFGCPAEARCSRVYARASDFYARGNTRTGATRTEIGDRSRDFSLDGGAIRSGGLRSCYVDKYLSGIASLVMEYE